MTLKEEFLQIKTYDELKKTKGKFRNLKLDRDVLKHYDELYGKGYTGEKKKGVTEVTLRKKV